jgi:hypothetical protein
MNQALGHDVSANLAPTFVADTAAKTGLSERTIQQSIHRAEKIAPRSHQNRRQWRSPDELAKATPERQIEAVTAVKSAAEE